VDRTEHGVPNIQADSWEDALYGLGYMHALDRGSQILFSRAVAAGRSAELLADRDDLFETDCFFRRMALPLDLEPEIDRLEPSIAAQLAVYCQGVSEGLTDMGRSLPVWAARLPAQLWDPASVLLIGKLLSFGGLAVGQLQNERLLMELIHAGVSDAALRELFAPRLEHADFALLRQVHMANPLSKEALQLLTDLPRLAGSNAWAIAPQRSATGFPLLASDPHLEVNRLPAIWYEAIVQWPRGYVMGATLPGCPLFAVARNRTLSWGVTYMKGDTIDYFVEDCRRGGATGWQYRRQSGWHDWRLRDERVGRKGKAAEVLRIWENDQGTLQEDPAAHGEGLHLSVAWSGRGPGAAEAMSTWVRLARTEDVSEAMELVRLCPQPTLCFVLSDRHGHIGLQGCGRFPRRRRFDDGLFPLPAWDQQNHWQGWLGPEVLPSNYDPDQGFVATANEERNSPDGPLLVTQILPGYRKRRIDQQLTQLPSATVRDMQQLQYDVYSVQAEDLLPVFLPHLPDDMRERLEKWDRRYDANSCDATLFHRLYIQVIIEIFGHEEAIGWRRILYLCTRAGYSMMVLQAADRLIKQESCEWLKGRDKGELIARAARQVMGQPDVPWGEFNSFHFTDRFFGGHSVGRLLGFDSRIYPMPGCHATPFQGHVFKTAIREQTFSPSYHFVTDMGTDQAWTNLPGGPNESRFSRFYKSDLIYWETGTYKRLELGTSGQRPPANR
jgi:penicillin amidase